MDVFGFMLFALLAGAALVLEVTEGQRKKKAREAERFDAPNVHGAAGFADDDELKRAGLFGEKGILIGHSSKGRPLRYDGDAMLTSIAPVGSGKGAVQVIPNCLSLDDRSLVVFCPKGETPAVTAHYRARLGPCDMLNPYEILLPEFKGIKQSRFNPMAVLSDPREPALNFHANAGKIAEGCTFHETENSESEFFSSAGRNLTHGVIMGVARHEAPERRNLIRVAEIISTGEIFAWSRKVVGITPDPHIKQKLGRFATGKEDDRTLAGILATADTNLSFLADDAIANCLSGSDFRFRDLRNRVSTVFVTVPVANNSIGGRFFKLITSSMLGDVFQAGRGKKRVVIILDECFSMGAVASLEAAVGIARGFGVTIWTLWQDLNQMEARYPRSYQTFLSNSGVRTFMTPQDEKTARYISEQCGITEVVSESKTVNYGRDDRDVRVSKGRNQQPRQLVLPHEAREMAQNKMLVFVRGVRGAIVARRKAYFEGGFRGKFRRNPYLS